VRLGEPGRYGSYRGCLFPHHLRRDGTTNRSCRGYGAAEGLPMPLAQTVRSLSHLRVRLFPELCIGLPRLQPCYMLMPVPFPLPILIPPTAPPGTGTVGQMVADVPNGLSLTPPQGTLKRRVKKSSISPSYKILEARHLMPAGSSILFLLWECTFQHSEPLQEHLLRCCTCSSGK
jgi:hypothetical protein